MAVFVTGQATGLASAVPVIQAYNAGIALPNIKVVLASGTTTNGTATIYPTSDGTQTGTPALSQILHADGVAWVSTSTATQVPFVSGKAISSDLKSVTFNVLTGNAIALGGNSVTQAPNGTTVTCVVWGMP